MAVMGSDGDGGVGNGDPGDLEMAVLDLSCNGVKMMMMEVDDGF